MKPDRRGRIMVLCAVLALGVGALDIASPLGVAAAALYSLVIVVSQLGDDTRVSRNVAVACAGLIVAGGLLSPASKVPLWIVLVNTALYLIVVAVTAWLVSHRQRAAQRIRDQHEQLEQAHAQLARQAREDSLTGLANRRAFDEQLAIDGAQANRSGLPMSLLMIDVDCFKRYNDIAGHVAGDACLRAVAGAIRGALRRPVDLATRYGGEEFAVVLPETDAAGAYERAEAICQAVRSLRIDHPGLGEGAIVTVSVGVGCLVSPLTTHELVEQADRMLYQAKAAGRDCVVAAERSESWEARRGAANEVHA